MTKLWILESRGGLKPRQDPWRGYLNQTYCMVIRAETEEDARAIATEHAHSEGGKAWADHKLSSCKELLPSGEPGIVVRENS